MSIGGNPIPEDSTAFTIAMNYLKSLPRPLKVKVYRDLEYDEAAHAHGDAPAANPEAAARASERRALSTAFAAIVSTALSDWPV